MSFQHFKPLLDSVNERLLHSDIEHAYEKLHEIPSDLFGLMLWRRAKLDQWPQLQGLIPHLPPEKIQAKFAGGKGEALLPRANFFASYLERSAERHFGTTNLNFLDYGCGWGRISRFLLRLTPLSKINLIDPKEEVPTLLGSQLLASRFHTVDARPSAGDLPRGIDVAYLFSVMTHTPPQVNSEIISALGQSLNSGGIVITTIRPKAFWRFKSRTSPSISAEDFETSHNENGYAYIPQPGNIDYGDSSYSHESIVSQFIDFEFVEANYCAVDPFQIMYCFRKR